MIKNRSVAAVVIAFFVCRAVFATGLMIPKKENLPPLGIKSHRVRVEVKDGVATTELTEVFLNSTKRRLEATYIFPVPADAALTDFAMYINGKRKSGEVVEASKARRIYQNIVRRMRDPGLLEYMGRRLLKLRVYPIQPESTQKIQVQYTNPVPFDNGVYRYTFPLKTGEKASRVLEDSTFGVEINSKHALANIYSPSHRIGITRKNDHKAIVGFEKEDALLDEDFVLYFTVAKKDFGLNLLSYRPDGKQGYFALMLAPRVELKGDEVMPKDVCFVVDTSGSMLQQNRMQSAKDAVKFCLKSLNEKDRFSLIPFSTGVDTFSDGLMKATRQNVERALGYTKGMEARGGTKLCGAVIRALEMAPDGNRPYIVVLITDGKPTIGIVDPEKIVASVKEANEKNVRVFSFGIAENLDVPLLDQITEATRGYSEYVAPGREIETEISAFFRKVSHPVLANLTLDFGKVKVRDMYPQRLPDLFRGSQVLVFGRYEGSGDVAVKLGGVMKGEDKQFAYDAEFPETSTDNGFIAHLWAQRKIAYLVDQIRLHGESKELKDAVVRLSKEYGIATPYTSYLVLENEKQYVRHGIVRRRSMEAAKAAAPSASATDAGWGGARRDDRKAEREEAYNTLDEAREMVGGKGADRDGKKAVQMSKAMRSWKESATTGEGGLGGVRTQIKKVGEKTFVRMHGVFVDSTFKEGMKELKVKWGSDAYFAAVEARPELKKYLAIGQYVIVVIDGKALIVGEGGKEDLSKKQIRAFFD
ncbi:MAG: VIT and vWA domain-containing protein [Candidatus Brocadiia bacterium]